MTLHMNTEGAFRKMERTITMNKELKLSEFMKVLGAVFQAKAEVPKMESTEHVSYYIPSILSIKACIIYIPIKDVENDSLVYSVNFLDASYKKITLHEILQVFAESNNIHDSLYKRDKAKWNDMIN